MVSLINAAPGVISREIAAGPGPEPLCAALRSPAACSLFFDGRGGFERPWRTGSLVAVEPRARLFPEGGGRAPASSWPGSTV